MALCTLSFNSTVLKRPEKIEILIPQDGFKGLRQKDDFSVLFILHGLHKDRKEWVLDSQLPFLVRELPVIYLCHGGSGDEDAWLDMNLIVRDCFEKLACPEYDYRYHEISRYGHEWSFWREELALFLNYIGLAD